MFAIPRAGLTLVALGVLLTLGCLVSYGQGPTQNPDVSPTTDAANSAANPNDPAATTVPDSPLFVIPPDTSKNTSSTTPANPAWSNMGGPFGMAGPFGMGGGMGGPGGAMGGAPGIGASYYPTTSVKGQNSDFSLTREHISAMIPAWQDGGDRLMLTASVRNTLIYTDAILPDSHQSFPTELWSINLGVNGMHHFDNGWTCGLSASVGSASDRPFNGLEEMNVAVFGFLRIPTQNDRDAWMFTLMYAPFGAQTGGVNFPIPGAAYQWNPSDELHVNLGIPFSVMWRPIEDLTLNLSYFPLINVNANATYKLSPKVNVYTGFQWYSESYHLADQTDSNQRFMGFEKRLMSGVRWNIWSHASFDFNGGYAFDRYYGEGTSAFSSNLTDRVDIGSGAFVGMNLFLRW